MSAADVEVRVTGLLARYLGGRTDARVAAGQPIMAAVAELGIPRSQPVVAVVNGRTCDLAEMLAAGDRLILMPPVAGGTDDFQQ